MLRRRINGLLMELCFREQPPTPQMDLRGDLGIDSLRMVELVVALEDAFGITFAQSDLDPQAYQRVADIYALVEKYGGAVHHAV